MSYYANPKTQSQKELDTEEIADKQGWLDLFNDVWDLREKLTPDLVHMTHPSKWWTSKNQTYLHYTNYVFGHGRRPAFRKLKKSLEQISTEQPQDEIA